MDKNRLEEFVNNQRYQFDEIEQPDLERLWKGIPKAEKKNHRPNNNAIAVIIFLLIGAIALLWLNNRQTEQKLNELQQFVMSSPKYQSEQNQLLVYINEKRDQVKKADIKQADYQEIFSELDELELIQKTLESDFNKVNNPDDVMKTLLRHYERKAKVLELLLFENEKRKYHENIIDNTTY